MGSLHKLAGSSPKTRFKLYSYYTTQSRPHGKDIHLPCQAIDLHIPGWLARIAIDLQRIPVIREAYRQQVAEFHEQDRGQMSKKIRTQLNQLNGEEARLACLYITGKISEATYDHLRAEWQENIRTAEAKLFEAERSIQNVQVDLDLALILLANASILYERLEEKDQARLLKILAKRIIVNPDGLITDQELHSPFTYLRNLAGSIGGSHRDSEQVRLGALEEAVSDSLSAF